MFNLGFGEMALVAILALIVLGPKQLPQLAHQLGRLLGQLREAKNEFSAQMYRAQDETNKFQQELENSIARPKNKAFDPPEFEQKFETEFQFPLELEDDHNPNYNNQVDANGMPVENKAPISKNSSSENT